MLEFYYEHKEKTFKEWIENNGIDYVIVDDCVYLIIKFESLEDKPIGYRNKISLLNDNSAFYNVFEPYFYWIDEEKYTVISLSEFNNEQKLVLFGRQALLRALTNHEF